MEQRANRVRILVAVMVALLCIGAFSCLSACKASTPEKPNAKEATLANPMVESTLAGVLEATGIDLPAPDGASNITHFYYKESADVLQPVAEVRFTLDGHEAYLRAQKTDMTAFPLSGEEIVAAAMAGKNLDNGADISGLHYQWECFSTQDVGSCEALCFRGGKVGYIAWIDASTGVLYNLCMKDGATDDVLLDLSNAAFTAIRNHAAK